MKYRHDDRIPTSSATRLVIEERSTARPVVAAACSVLLPGLGQVVNGQIGKGLLVFLTSFLIIPYVFGVIDAYVVARRQGEAHGYLVEAPPVRLLAPAKPLAEQRPSLEQQLLAAAEKRGGELSVTEGVLATGLDFGDVEGKLDEMCRSGYVEIGNRAGSGVVVYRFPQLASWSAA